MTMTRRGAQTAAKAADVTETLKWSRTYDTAPALALFSISQILAEVAEYLEERQDPTQGF
jgi:hypothetical protein